MMGMLAEVGQRWSPEGLALVYLFETVSLDKAPGEREQTMAVCVLWQFG